MNGDSKIEASAFQDYVKERCLYLDICRRYHLAPLDLEHLLQVSSGLSLEDRLRLVRLIYRLRDLEMELQDMLDQQPFTEAASLLDRGQIH